MFRFLSVISFCPDNIEPIICFCPDNIEPYLSAEPAVVMKKAKLDSTIEPAVVVAPQDVDLEEDDIDVVDVDVKIEGEELHNDGRRYGGFLKEFQLVMMGGKGQNVRDAQKDTSVKQKLEQEACEVT
uniref:Uncharacterized protein n=1 Tax=Lactuca sativa TaxID=4236 RepID=A0A9R1WEM9_LACSA|nr:hypothetical protein LSAT_V11C200088950 [Lactuca sativa]